MTYVRNLYKKTNLRSNTEDSYNIPLTEYATVTPLRAIGRCFGKRRVVYSRHVLIRNNLSGGMISSYGPFLAQLSHAICDLLKEAEGTPKRTWFRSKMNLSFQNHPLKLYLFQRSSQNGSTESPMEPVTPLGRSKPSINQWTLPFFSKPLLNRKAIKAFDHTILSRLRDSRLLLLSSATSVASLNAIFKASSFLAHKDCPSLLSAFVVASKLTHHPAAASAALLVLGCYFHNDNTFGIGLTERARAPKPITIIQAPSSVWKLKSSVHFLNDLVCAARSVPMPPQLFSVPLALHQTATPGALSYANTVEALRVMHTLSFRGELPALQKFYIGTAQLDPVRELRLLCACPYAPFKQFTGAESLPTPFECPIWQLRLCLAPQITSKKAAPYASKLVDLMISCHDKLSIPFAEVPPSSVDFFNETFFGFVSANPDFLVSRAKRVKSRTQSFRTPAKCFVKGAPSKSFLTVFTQLVLKRLRRPSLVVQLIASFRLFLRSAWGRRKLVPTMDEKMRTWTCLLHQKLTILNCAMLSLNGVVPKCFLNDRVSAFDPSHIAAAPGTEGERVPPRVPTIPPLQNVPARTEDQIFEAEEIVKAIREKKLPNPEHVRLKMLAGRQLVSDMSAFKAANPGAELGDFLAWHSPADVAWDGERYQLLQRMTWSSSNIWHIAWENAEPLSVEEQPPLFNAEREGEAALHLIEQYSDKQIFRQLICVYLFDVYMEFASNESARGRALEGYIRSFQLALQKLCSSDAGPDPTADEARFIAQLHRVRESLYKLEVAFSVLFSLRQKVYSDDFDAEEYDQFEDKLFRTVSGAPVTIHQADVAREHVLRCFNESPNTSLKLATEITLLTKIANAETADLRESRTVFQTTIHTSRQPGAEKPFTLLLTAPSGARRDPESGSAE
eukprot:gnl/Chilomastix_cuspidata/1651.p1 GENE.gnl/Chilomastix_cuspidata/1651~~gnl/Chilomastix_cuspidata/1651.p1  ORF type:complete len:941 (+),score=228.34 gnl/Chilomastix_cuspidata/1651:121-2823(+)